MVPRPNFLFRTVSHGPETKFFISRTTHKNVGLFCQEFADNQQIFGIGQKKSLKKKWQVLSQVMDYDFMI